MSFHLKTTTRHFTVTSAMQRTLMGVLLVVLLGACSSQGAREAEMAAIEAERVAMEQETARIAFEQERQLAAERQRQREAEVAEQARLQAQIERQEEAARARADAEQRQREAAERRERERLAAIAAAESERQEKLDRIAELEAQISSLQADTRRQENSGALLTQAVGVAEELLDVLAAEQSKYESTDGAGNTTVPLAKEQIAELEARKNELVRRASAQ